MDIVQHCHVEFSEGSDPENSFCFRQKFSQKEDKIIQNEIEKLLEMKVIEEVEHTPGEYISPIFIVPKKNGEYRMILNLKELNENIVYHHFKMETFESALKLVKKNCYFASVDLRHAYYSVPLSEEIQKKFRFQKSGKVYQYTSLPNGVACAPRLFTKLMKPVYASLRMLGHTNSGYIDDSLLVADTFTECEHNVHDTVSLMTDLGFIVHNKKSVLIPTQNITFLGNNIDSDKMIVTLPPEKVLVVVQECEVLHSKCVAKIRDVARVLGLMVSSFSAVEYGPLFYRQLEMAKIQSLKVSKGDYEAIMYISAKMKEELVWWINHLPTQKRVIDHGNASTVITTDASSAGWGAICNNSRIGGRWNAEEFGSHINFLELLAVNHALKAFCKAVSNTHIQIRSDNSCTVSYLNHMGGIRSEQCNGLAKDIWIWCMNRNIWLSASHVPGSKNEADFESRNFKENVEWKLNEAIFAEIVQIWGLPSIDMFASRLNKQVDQFVSWTPDPDAIAVNSFSLNWANYALMYAFVPFSLIGRTLSKLRQDGGEMILIAPIWVTQNWFPVAMEMLIDRPRMFSVQNNTLTIPGTCKVHPLSNKLQLMACRISGSRSKAEEFRLRLQISSWRLGDAQLRNSIPHISTNGFSTVIKGKLINFIPL